MIPVLLLFAASVIIFSRVLPRPHSETDYLIIGTLSTFVALLALFLVLIATVMKMPETFFKRRKR